VTREGYIKHASMMDEWMNNPDISISRKGKNSGEWTQMGKDADMFFHHDTVYAIVDEYYEERKVWAEGKDIWALTNIGSWEKINSTTSEYPFTLMEWQKFKLKQEWYDNIPEEGVLCWVSDDSINTYSKKTARRVYTYRPNYQKKFEVDANHKQYKFAIPVTKEEIMDVD